MNITYTHASYVYLYIYFPTAHKSQKYRYLVVLNGGAEHKSVWNAPQNRKR